MWPLRVTDLFRSVDAATCDESGLIGPFNALLDFCFPWEEGWNVVPQFLETSDKHSVDFMTVLLVRQQKLPLFFLQLKPSCHVHNLGTRAFVDKQTRELFANLCDKVQTPRLHAFSACGTQLAHYKLNCQSMELMPHETLRDIKCITDTAPASLWNIDLLTEEGSARFMEVVKDVKQMSDKSSLSPKFRLAMLSAYANVCKICLETMQMSLKQSELVGQHRQVYRQASRLLEYPLG